MDKDELKMQENVSLIIRTFSWKVEVWKWDNQPLNIIPKKKLKATSAKLESSQKYLRMMNTGIEQLVQILIGKI